MRLEMARVQTLVVELAAVVLGIRQGRWRGGVPTLEATGTDFKCFIFLLYFSFC